MCASRRSHASSAWRFRVTGLRVRGWFEVSVAATDGQLTPAAIRSTIAASCRAGYGRHVTAHMLEPAEGRTS